MFAGWKRIGIGLIALAIISIFVIFNIMTL